MSRITEQQVSRPALSEKRVQVSYGEAATEVPEVMPYGLQHHLPAESHSLVVSPENENLSLALPGYIANEPHGLEQGEVALYSEHGQVLYYKDDGSLHLEAAGKVSIHSDQEDLYNLLKDLLEIIKNLTTAPIDTQVKGGSVSGGSVTGNGNNPGVGMSADAKTSLDQIADRLDKLLQAGEKPQTAEEQEKKQEKKQKEEQAKQKEEETSSDNEDQTEDDTENTPSGPGSLTNKGQRTVYAIFNEKDPPNAQGSQGVRAVAVAPGEKREGFLDAVVDLTVPLIIKTHESSNIVFDSSDSDKRNSEEQFKDDLFTIDTRGYFAEFEANQESESNYGLYVLKGEDGKAAPDSANPVYSHYGFWGNRYKTNGTLRKGIADYKNANRAIADNSNPKRITEMSKTGVTFQKGAGWVDYAKDVKNKNEQGATP
ncbi:hypothetical protein P0082_00890 [Candidatus Haliotispira prima]|uniref:Uncharacterized protein n=1 Tax=Candidatus Haliotispira prima TaxID=3034016 RepID=A0ABY8MKW3_9SPIO|nr:hypothetical protein P0082_00890 [Candidatus Haliotispira prima]